MVPSDADGGDGDDDDDGGVPTTLPAWQGPRGYHGQGSNIPFGESLTLIYIYIYIYIHSADTKIFIHQECVYIYIHRYLYTKLI